MIDLKGNYLIDEDGKIYSTKGKGKYLNPSVNAGGYYVVSIYVDGVKKQYKVHDLVAETFIPNPDNKKYVHHIDKNKLNNSVSNLMWVTKEEHSSIHGDKRNRAYVFTEETKKKMSESAKGKIISTETRKKISNALKGKTQSEEHRLKRAESKKMPVIQYDKKNNFIKEWKSALDAEIETNISRCHIAQVCKGYRKTAGGFVWKYGFKKIT